jgi:hypothetical protein
MDTNPIADPHTSIDVKKTRPARGVDERIAALTEQLAALRTKQSERKRKEAAQLAQIIGTTILAAVNDNTDPELRASVTKHLRARVTRPAQRELVEKWLASQSV